jgi:hypothetical protein
MSQTDKRLEYPETQNTERLWYPYTGNLKQVIHHMEAGHYQKWCDLVLYPQIAGGRY